MPTKQKANALQTAVARDAHWAAKMQRIRDRKPKELDLTVWIDESLKDVLTRAQKSLIAARATAEMVLDQNEPDDDKVALAQERLADAEREYAEAQEAAAEASVTLWLRGLPRTEYEELIAGHPPTDEQKEAGQAYNDETFAPALISACHVDKVPSDELDDQGQPILVDSGESMSPAEADELLETLSQSEAMMLFTSAIAACTASRIDVGKGSGPTRR